MRARCRDSVSLIDRHPWKSMILAFISVAAESGDGEIIMRDMTILRASR